MMHLNHYLPSADNILDIDMHVLWKNSNFPF